MNVFPLWSHCSFTTRAGHHAGGLAHPNAQNAGSIPLGRNGSGRPWHTPWGSSLDGLCTRGAPRVMVHGLVASSWY